MQDYHKSKTGFPFWEQLGTKRHKKDDLGRIGQNLWLSHSQRSSAISLPFGSALAAIWQAGGGKKESDILPACRQIGNRGIGIPHKAGRNFNFPVELFPIYSVLKLFTGFVNAAFIA
jgi:hypothetical protein